MKKIVLLVGGLVLLTACQDTKSNNDSTRDSLLEKYQAKESSMDTERKTINLKEYKFFIPRIYDDALVKDSKKMEEFLFNQKEIEVQDLPISTIMYGGTYDKQNEMFITLMYLVNNTDREIENISFEYHLDLTTIDGEDEGDYPYNYKKINDEIISPKTIVPIFLGSKNIKLSPQKDSYFGEDLSKIEVNNIIIDYKDGLEESNK